MKRRELLLLLGGAMIAARGLCAQQKSMPVIGFLGSTAPGPFEAHGAAFRKGLSDSGYVEDKTWRSDIARRRATTIGCLPWPPTSSTARST